MQENSNNINWVCPEHAPKPNSQYFEKPFEWFIGKYCKLGFPTERDEPPFIEFMWVYVTDFREDGSLLGSLNNAPLFVKAYKDGDGVIFERNEICEVE